jgi:hypothetical protein
MTGMRRAVEIRRGDYWRFLTNTGYMMRHVRSVAMGTVYYIDGDGKMCRCSLATFRRWLGPSNRLRAELWSADDWSGREPLSR